MDSGRVFKVIDALITVVGAVVRAAARGDKESVDKILGDDLEMTVARAAAEARAQAKFASSAENQQS